MAKRSYTNGKIIVHWDSDLCVHCGYCHQKLPAVFNPEARPWVNMKGATTEEITEQVKACPSGALQVEEVVTTNPSAELQKKLEEQKERIRSNFGGGFS